jgi:hypothetical protein
VSVEELVAKNRELEKLLKKREKEFADEKETVEILKKWLCWANPYARPRLVNFPESVSPFQAVYSLRNRSFFGYFGRFRLRSVFAVSTQKYGLT